MFKLEGLRASTFTDGTFATGEGYTIINKKRAVALPCKKALRKWVRLFLPTTGQRTVVQVLDVGPYLWWDDFFVLEGNRPLVETYYESGERFPSEDIGEQCWSKVSFAGKAPNSRASVDLTPPVWWDLGVGLSEEGLRSFSTDELEMEWFVEPNLDSDNEDEGIPEWLRI